MDPLTIANSLVGLLTPILAKGVGEVANSAFKDLYASIKEKLSGKPKDKDAVEQFEKDPPQGASAFQAVLVEHLNVDQELLKEITEVLKATKTASPLVNNVNAKNVVIADDINNINMS